MPRVTRQAVLLICLGLMLVGGVGCATWFSAEPAPIYAPQRVPPASLSSVPSTAAGATPAGPQPESGAAALGSMLPRDFPTARRSGEH